jgi:hypothetical protein
VHQVDRGSKGDGCLDNLGPSRCSLSVEDASGGLLLKGTSDNVFGCDTCSLEAYVLTFFILVQAKQLKLCKSSIRPSAINVHLYGFIHGQRLTEQDLWNLLGACANVEDVNEAAHNTEALLLAQLKKKGLRRSAYDFGIINSIPRPQR